MKDLKPWSADLYLNNRQHRWNAAHGPIQIDSGPKAFELWAPQTGDPVGRRDAVTLISISRLLKNFVALGVVMVTLSCFRRVSSSQSRSLSTAMVGIASASILLVASAVSADPPRPVVNDKFGDYAAAITELRLEAGQDRRNIVKANMLLTETESARFWPLYDQYRAERQKIWDRRARLVTEFLTEQNSMNEDEARTLANEDFAIEKDTSELRAKWYEKMAKVLSERTVARFFHIDEKLDASVDLALAANIPLIH
jgi:Spy/CpxP family protein refolding chaperone